MYKKFASVFLMVSLSLFIFNLSHAGFFEAGVTYSFTPPSTHLTPNYETKGLLGYSKTDVQQLVTDFYNGNIEEFKEFMNALNVEFGYDSYLIINNSEVYTAYFYNSTEMECAIRQYNSNYIPYFYLKDSNDSFIFLLGSNGNFQMAKYTTSTGFISKGSFPTSISYLTNRPLKKITTSWDGETYFSEANSEISSAPSMQNPLTDEEIKSILQIFLDSVRNSGLPEHYGRYVLAYNKETDRYVGYVYPSYVNLGMRYGDFDEVGNFYRVEGGVSNYYYFCQYTEDEDYISQFLDGISFGMSKPLLYEFKSNDTKSYFNYVSTYDMDVLTSPKLSFDNEPIIYTSHKIYSLFWVGNDILGFAQLEVDENTSIEYQEFVDEETGIIFDNSINNSTKEENSNVNFFSIVKVLFKFFYSLLNFLLKFFVFITTLINIPASTNILPPEFVVGIDWLKTFSFGDVLLYDIFSITFGILLSIYIFNLIKSTSSS